IDMVPKPVAGRLPVLITGGAQQSPDWVAEHGDGWMTYPRDPAAQARLVRAYRQRSIAVGAVQKPVMQSLYVDLVADADADPRPIHLGFRSGVTFLKSYLADLQAGGINHVALNLRFNGADFKDTLNRLADHLLPVFQTKRPAA
ncbi:MAG: LLM class flavin-dependent oxidoreductase, partial [Pseudomonadota bacterium]